MEWVSVSVMSLGHIDDCPEDIEIDESGEKTEVENDINSPKRLSPRSAIACRCRDLKAPSGLYSENMVTVL